MQLLLAALACYVSCSAARKFVHPGVFLGSDQIAYMRQQAAIAGSPFNVTLGKALRWTWMNKRNASSQ
eukprot:gene7446-6979_t